MLGLIKGQRLKNLCSCFEALKLFLIKSNGIKDEIR